MAELDLGFSSDPPQASVDQSNAFHIARVRRPASAAVWSMEELLRISDLRVNYRIDARSEIPAVAGVSLTIHAGEALGLLGESGCGKTSTALSVMRLLPDSARILGGSVLFRGRNLLELHGREMERVRGREISLIFQEPSVALNPVLSVGDQVAEVLHAHRPWGRRRCREEALNLLALVRLKGIDRVFRSYPHELSGGEKQRVLIAQALACRPALIIADEPTAGLDTRTQAEILDLLRELKAGSRTAFLFISHHPGVLGRLADRMLVMYAGKIVEEGEVTLIRTRPLHPYTRGLLGSMPVIPDNGNETGKRRPVPIAGNPPDPADLPRGCSFAPRCPMRMETCLDLEPQEHEVGNRQRVRCHVV
jgi:peptide/nickel transport system ATP-binding protein